MEDRVYAYRIEINDGGYASCIINKLYPTREIAENVRHVYEQFCLEPFRTFRIAKVELFARSEIEWFESLPKRRTFNGKHVLPKEWVFRFGLAVGDYVESSYIDFLRKGNFVSDNGYMIQERKSFAQKMDRNGDMHAVFCTYKRINEETYEYCGLSFHWQTEESGEFIANMWETE